MLVLASNFNHGAVILNNAGKIADIDFLVFKEENLSLLGAVCVKPLPKFFSPSIIIKAEDIVNIESGNIYIANENAPQKLPSQKKLIASMKRDPLTGKKVKTSRGQYVGKLYDILFDTETLLATKIYTANFLDKKIIPVEKIIKIHRRYVEISDIIELNELEEKALA